MGRIKLSPKRQAETRKANIGKIIIFCEGYYRKILL